MSEQKRRSEALATASTYVVFASGQCWLDALLSIPDEPQGRVLLGYETATKPMRRTLWQWLAGKPPVWEFKVLYTTEDQSTPEIASPDLDAEARRQGIDIDALATEAAKAFVPEGEQKPFTREDAEEMARAEIEAFPWEDRPPNVLEQTKAFAKREQR